MNNWGLNGQHTFYVKYLSLKEKHKQINKAESNYKYKHSLSNGNVAKTLHR